MTFKYNAISDKLGSIQLDPYNRNDSELVFVEAKVIKSEDTLYVYGVLMGNCNNITKQIKGSDGKYANDPEFKLPDMPVVRLDLPLKQVEKISKAGKAYTVGSVSEIFIAEKLLADIGDGGMFEGTLDIGIDRGDIDKVNEYLALGEPGAKQAEKKLSKFYEVTKIDVLTIVNDEIINAGNTVKQGNGSYGSYGNKTYQKAETESEKLQARSEYVKRFLADNWDDSVDYKAVTFDSCLDVYKGRESVMKDKQGDLLIELLQAILP